MHHPNPAVIIIIIISGWLYMKRPEFRALRGFIYDLFLFPPVHVFPTSRINNRFSAKDVISKSITLDRCELSCLTPLIESDTQNYLRSLRTPPSFRGTAKSNSHRKYCFRFATGWLAQSRKETPLCNLSVGTFTLHFCLCYDSVWACNNALVSYEHKVNDSVEGLLKLYRKSVNGSFHASAVQICQSVTLVKI